MNTQAETITELPVADIVARLVAEQRDPRRAPGAVVTAHARLVADLGFDELDVLELVMTAEKEWDIEITDEEEARLTTVQSMVDLVNRKLHAIAYPCNPRAPA